MAKDKVTIVVPNEDKFSPAPIPFGIVTGDGVDNYNEDGKEYTVSIILDKKQAKDVRSRVLAFWDANKPKNAPDEPSNIAGIVREHKDENGDFDGSYIMYAKTQTEFQGQKGGTIKNVVPMVNQKGDKIDPEEFGLIGNGSEGRIAVTLAIYEQGKKKGVSVFLSAVKLTKHAPLESAGGASAFGKDDEGEIESTGGFKSEKKKDKNKKKGRDIEDDEDEDMPVKKAKAHHDDDDDDDDEDKPVKKAKAHHDDEDEDEPIKEKKKDKKKKKKNKEKN